MTEEVEFAEVDEDFVDARADREKLSQSVVATTDWTTETLITQLKRGNIQLNPRFQRRDAWSRPRKSRFIESLILGLPVPQIVLAERRDARGKYIVLDGKQRLLSLLQFEGSGNGGLNGFSLSGLEVLADQLNGKTFRDLSDDPELAELSTAFANQTVRAVIIKNWPDVLFLHLVFLRLNTGSVKLSPQELRQALFPGGFSDFVDDAAQESEQLKILLKLDEPDFRMRDVELLVRHLAFKNFMTSYRGELKIFLDSACETLNLEWEQRRDAIHDQVDQFNCATAALIEIFGLENVARKPVVGARRPFNRAIFDVLIYYAANADVCEAMLRSHAQVRDAFSRLYSNDQAFVRSIESTTKTVEATVTRFGKWGDALSEALGMALSVPRLDNGRITI